MKYRLGIDLGTSSIGTAAYSLGDNNDIQDLIYLDSYIFGEPVDPKALVTKNTDRRSARLIRRQQTRKVKRLRKISYIARSIGIQKSDLDKIPGDKIHELRAKAISQKIELPELIKVFCHVVKNRGYKGDLKRAEGTVSSKIKETKEMLKDKQTLGELLYDKKQQAEKNHTWRKLNQDGTFIERDFIENEFELIWKEQEKHHTELKCNYKIGYQDMHCWNIINGVKTPISTAMFLDYKDEKEILLKDAFKSAMFYQRPIKWKLDSVGHCSLEQDEFRSAVAQIAYQNYRLAKSISDLRIRNMQNKTERYLKQDEITKIYDFVLKNFPRYNNRNKIAFHLIYEELNLKNERFTIDRTRGDDKKEDGLKGNTTLKCFYDLLDTEKVEFINAFNELSVKAKELALEFLANITKYADIQENSENIIDAEFPRLTQNIFNKTEDDNKKAIFFIKLLRTNEVFYNDKFSLEQGRGSYSVKVLEKLTPELLKGRNEQDIIEEIYPQKSPVQDSKLQNSQLRDYEKIKTNNPVVDKCLREFKRTMDFIVKKFEGNPAEITIELTRELKNPLAKRRYIESQNDIAKKERTAAIKELQSNGINLTSENIEKYLLRQEQDGTCPYCGQTISIGDIINKTQIDHIVPQSKGGPNIFSNKILAHTQCNYKKGERIPYEFKFKDDIDNYIDFLKTLSAKKKTKKSEVNVAQNNERAEFGNNSPLINLAKSLWQKYNKEKKGYYDQRKKQWTATQKGKRLRDKIDFILVTSDDVKDLIGDFSDRLTSFAWINKIILDWCKDICPKVTPSFGTLTAYFRGKYCFNDVLPMARIAEKKSLFNEDNKDIDSAKWQEINKKYLDFSEGQALSQDFEKYIGGLGENDKPLNNTDKQKQFDKFRRDLRKLDENKFYKRIDHRHHAVDAAVIGLSTLSLIQQASSHNKRWGGLREVRDDKGEVKIPGFEIKEGTAKLYREIKDKTQEYLTNYIVWHKPDRLPSGKFFDETAYNIVEKDGVKRIAVRQTLEKIIDKVKDKDSLIKKLNLVIVGDEIKKRVLMQFNDNIAKGFSFEESFLGTNGAEPLSYRGDKIKQLKVMYKQKGLMKFNDGVDAYIGDQKVYQNYGYACMDFDKQTGELLQSIPLWKYQNNNHNLTKNIVRLFIDDIVYDKDTKEFYKVKKFNSTQGRLICTLASESNGNEKGFSNTKNIILIKDRQDLAKIKKDLKNESETL
jgi:CRISPR-associated endonuclease Csn1